MEVLKGDVPQALERVKGPRTPRILDQRIVVLLSMRDVAHWNGRSGLHERAAEEALGVPAVRDELQRDRDRTRALAPAAAYAF